MFISKLIFAFTTTLVATSCATLNPEFVNPHDISSLDNQTYLDDQTNDNISIDNSTKNIEMPNHQGWNSSNCAHIMADGNCAHPIGPNLFGAPIIPNQ